MERYTFIQDPPEELPSGAKVLHQLRPEYKIKFSRAELQMLFWLIPTIFQEWRGLWSTHLVEILTLHDFHRKHRDKITAGRDVKIKVRAHELISLKRVLMNTNVSAPHDEDARTLLAKLDELTVQIY